MDSTVLPLSVAAFVLITALGTNVYAADTPSPATVQLQQRSTELHQELINLTDNVYVAIGYGVSVVSIIEGKDGLIIVDTSEEQAIAKVILTDLRKITNKPIKAIIYTHSHSDHIGGASVFAESGHLQIWGGAGFQVEDRAFAASGLQPVARMRGVRQAGMLLPPSLRINNGIAPARRPVGRFGDGFIPPTNLLTGPSQVISIAGVRLEIVAAPGETQDQVYVWLPKQKVVFAGDNFYQSWPNTYAIRGTPYRDVKSWISSLTAMLAENPHYLVGGHTRPISGQMNTKAVLTNYRDAVQYVWNETIKGINAGQTPDQLAVSIQLPAHLASFDYLGEYYGAVPWTVRAIFSGYLGWFDGNASNLRPIAPEAEAIRVARLAGGRTKLTKAAARALKDGDYQWAAQLADYLILLTPKDSAPKLLKADALELIAERTLTATGRNYYLTAAGQLRRAAGQKSYLMSPVAGPFGIDPKPTPKNKP